MSLEMLGQMLRSKELTMHPTSFESLGRKRDLAANLGLNVVHIL